MFKYLQLRHDVGVYLDYSAKILDWHECPFDRTFDNWNDNARNMADSYENAAELAASSPRQSTRVFDAISLTLNSPLTTPKADERLIKAARSLQITDAQKKELDRAAGVQTVTVPDRFGYTFDMAEAAVEGALRYKMFERAQHWLTQLKSSSTDANLYTQALCTLAKNGCASTIWKGAALLDAVVASIETPEQLVAVTKAVPNFMQRVAEHGVLGMENLESVLEDGWMRSDDIKALSEQYYAEKTITNLHKPIPPEEKLVLQQYAEASPDFQARAAANLIRYIPLFVRSGDGERAEELLNLLGAVSGVPLNSFNMLASNELCIGPAVAYPTGSIGWHMGQTYRPMVAAPEAYDTDWDVQHANDMSKFKLVHGADTLSAIDVLKLHIKGFADTDNTDRLRRATFDAASAHLGKSEVSLAAAWGALCVQSEVEETKRLGAKLISASLKLQAV